MSWCLNNTCIVCVISLPSLTSSKSSLIVKMNALNHIKMRDKNLYIYFLTWINQINNFFNLYYISELCVGLYLLYVLEKIGIFMRIYVDEINFILLFFFFFFGRKFHCEF